jgi:hypothetical protein
MTIWRDFQGAEIVLEEDVKRIIFQKHPEVQDVLDRIPVVLQDPDLVKRSATNPRVRLYYRYFDSVLDGKYLVVVVKRVEQSFVSTIYVTDHIKKGDVIWKK